MRRNISNLLIGIMCFGLSGCYEYGIRFWNNTGWEPPPAKKKARKECFEELESIPEPQNKSSGSKEMQDWLSKVYDPAERECMKRKGF